MTVELVPAGEPSRPPQRRRRDRAPGRLLPATIGAYELFDHVGRGGMADIYRARSTDELGVVREVVVKVVLPELAHSERLTELLISEAKLASRLDHPNVIRVENLGRADDDTLYIAMEWMDGLDLRDLLRQCARRSVALPIDISLFVVREILRGLDYAHRAIVHTDDGEERRGIVHRDVSPSNVLLSLDGEVKICDFGIARAHDEERDAAWSEAMVEGKAGYMSPEQANGQPLDPRADVFAAGIILWELLAGRRLYRSEGEEPLLAVAQRAAVADLPRRDLPFEDELHAIVGRALAKDREERFGSAAEMAAAIEDYASRADLRAGARTLRRFIAENFAGAVLAARRRRELATRAMARGPLAVFEVLDVPVVGMVPSPPADVDGAEAPVSLGPLSQRDIIFSKSALVLLAISAILVAYLVMRAVHAG